MILALRGGEIMAGRRQCEKTEAENTDGIESKEKNSEMLIEKGWHQHEARKRGEDEVFSGGIALILSIIIINMVFF
jgi:hypothetical protein